MQKKVANDNPYNDQLSSLTFIGTRQTSLWFIFFLKKMCNVKERKKCVRYLQPYGILHMYLNINYLRSYVMTQANFQTKGQVNYAHWIMNTGNSIHDTLTSLSNNQASHTNIKKMDIFNSINSTTFFVLRTWYKRYCSKKD